MKKRKLLLPSTFVAYTALLLVVLISGPLSPAIAGDVVVICNKNVPVNSLEPDIIRNIFLGHKSKWNNDEFINFVTLSRGSTHKNFCKKYLKKSPGQFGSFWKQMLFTGKGQPPKSFNSEEEMIEYITATKGSIGYASANINTDKVKIISEK